MSFLADLLTVFLFFLALKVTDLQSALFKVTMLCKTQCCIATCSMLSGLNEASATI